MGVRREDLGAIAGDCADIAAGLTLMALFNAQRILRQVVKNDVGPVVGTFREQLDEFARFVGAKGQDHPRDEANSP